MQRLKERGKRKTNMFIYLKVLLEKNIKNVEMFPFFQYDMSNLLLKN